MALVKRNELGRPLTFAELDGNFDEITAQIEAAQLVGAFAQSAAGALGVVHSSGASSALVDWQLFTYAAGSLTPQATYQDAALTIANANPVILDARGEVVMYGSGAYRIILKDKQGNTIYDRDNIQTPQSVVDTLSTALAAAPGAALVGFQQAGAATRTVQDKLRDFVDTKDYSEVGDPDSTQSFIRAIAANDAVRAKGAHTISSPIIINRDGVKLDFSHAKITYTGAGEFIRLTNDAKYCDIDYGRVKLTQDAVTTVGVLIQKARFNNIRGRIEGTYNTSNGATSANAVGVKVLGAATGEDSYLNNIDGYYEYLGYPVSVENSHTAYLSLTNTFTGATFLCKRGAQLKGAAGCVFRFTNYECWSPTSSFTIYELLKNASGVVSRNNEFYLGRVEFHQLDNISSITDAGCVDNHFEVLSSVYDMFHVEDGNSLMVVANGRDHTIKGRADQIAGGTFYDRNRIFTPEAFGSWTKNGDVVTADNVTEDPFGGIEADSITTTAGGIGHYLSRLVPSLSSVEVLTRWTGSVWLRADTPHRAQLKIQTDGYASAGGAFEQAVWVTTKWRRYHVSGEFTAGSNSVQFNIYPMSGKVYAYGGMLNKGRLGAFLRGDNRVRTDIDGGIATMKTLIGKRLGLMGETDSAVKIMTFASAAPATGAWQRGDIVYNQSPIAGGFVGWVCVAGGTPGTWNTFGAISA